MAPTTYTVQLTAAETALKMARDAGDVAAMLAALATITRAWPPNTAVGQGA